MDDEVLRGKCAEALGWVHLGAVGTGEAKRSGDPKKSYCLSGFNDWWRNPEGELVCGPCQGIPDPTEPAQAFELLCWLAERGNVEIEFKHGYFVVWIRGEGEYSFECADPAELRLALMRATVKVHEGRGK